MSFHNDPWREESPWEQDAPDRWERAEQAERAEEIERDRLTRDVGERGPGTVKAIHKTYRGGVCR